MFPSVVSATNVTDETNCENWPCSTFYTICDNVWNCKDGHDELKCRQVYQCDHDSYYCVDKSLKYTCKSNISDCIGSTNDRKYCRENYPTDFHLRYRCLNDTKCISSSQLCDCVIDCPLHEDDENLLCTLDYCQPNEYHCKDGRFATRCNSIIECRQFREDELFCDLTDIPSREKYFQLSFEDFDPYPSILKDNSYPMKLFDTHQRNMNLSSIKNVDNVFLGWYCHRGILIRKGFSSHCLCSPAYYGNRCEFESDRVSLAIEFVTPPLVDRKHVFKTFIYLFDMNQNIIDHEQVIYSDINYCSSKYFFYLLYSKQPKISGNYFIRLDSYLLHYQEEIRYIQSWYYPIQFHFLPVYRLATRIKLSTNPMAILKCGQIACIHGQCMEYVNIREKFCHCFPGWTGISCNIQVNCQCAKGSVCIANNICVCPIGRTGPLCRVPYDICQPNRCRNNGTCLPLDERAYPVEYNEYHQQFVCLCRDGYSGKYCELVSGKIHLEYSSLLSTSILIHLINTAPNGMEPPRRRSLFQKFPSNSKLTIYNTFIERSDYLPNLIYIQTFGDHTITKYYLIGIFPGKISDEMNISINSLNQCLHINELFNSTILKMNVLTRMKFYQKPCLEKQVKCFYDDHQMCLCNKFDKVDCFEFNHSLITCEDSFCLNNGLCIQDEDSCQSRSICICKPCYYGTYCQLTTQNYILSLDGIIGQYILRDQNIFQQPFLIQISVIVISLMFLFGILLNLLSILTFRQIKIPDMGCRIYLLCSAIISLLIMIIFLMKLIYLLITQIYLSLNETIVYLNCILIEYCIRIFPSIFDWLNSCVAIERTLTVIFGVKFNRNKSVQMAKLMIILIVLITVLSFIHDPINRRLINDEDDQSLWCTISFQEKSLLNSYNSSINFIHFLIPFGINIISSLVIIFETSRIHSNTRKQKSFGQHFKSQLNELKHLIIGPCILVLLSLPRLIISFVYSCMRTTDRNAFIFLFFYCISFIPPLAHFIIFVLPSQTYKQDFLHSIKHLF